jgi:hypothetical protein
VSEHRLRRGEHVLWRESLDAVLLLPVGTAPPITLVGTGPEVWELLAAPASAPELARELATRHDADPATVEADLAPVLDRLVALGVIEPVP